MVPELVEDLRPDDDVGNEGFVFERGEDDAFRAAGTLPHKNMAFYLDPPSAIERGQLLRPCIAAPSKLVTQEPTGWAFSDSRIVA